MGTHDNPSQQHPSPLIPDSTTGQSSAADPIVIDKVAEFVDRFIFLPVRAQYRLIATWVVVTYQSECFEYAPYLFIHSPEPSCGKSLLLEILAEFVHNPTEVLISPTPAVLFRTAAKFTQLMDEVDSWTNVDELKGVLNAGFKRGGVVVRLDPDGKGGYVPTPHQVYCPRALAGIGLGILHGTTRDRTFIIGMKKSSKCNGMRCTSVFCIPVPINFSANTSAKNVAGIASKPRTTQRECRGAPLSCCGEQGVLEHRSAYSVTPSITTKESLASAASWVSSPWPRNTAPRLSKMPAPRPWRSVCRSIASCVRYLERRPQLTLRQVDPLIRELTEYRDFINLKTQEPPE